MRLAPRTLYGTNDRAWKFWEQARGAERQSGTDALEVCYLCVMLGFRGELRQRPEQLQTWVAAAKARIAKVEPQESAFAGDLDPPTRVPPRLAQEKFQRAVLLGCVLLLLLIPVAAFLLIYLIGQ